MLYTVNYATMDIMIINNDELLLNGEAVAAPQQSQSEYECVCPFELALYVCV